MTRTSPASTYDDDFFAWTQEQAAALRRLPEVADVEIAHLDIAHVAEEIEDLGKRDLREVSSYLARLLEHLIKIDTCSDSIDRPHWASEAQRFQDSARAAYTPSMFRLLDLDKIWQRGRRAARSYLEQVGLNVAIIATCPFSLEDLLIEDFDFKVALAKLAAARATERRP